jgi:ketosteroid isomerase-like protein
MQGLYPETIRISKQNVELIRRAYEAFDTDLEALLGLLDPAIEWVSPSDSIEPGPRRGHRGVRDAFAATAMAWDRPTHTPKEFAHASDKVLVTVSFRGHGRGSGMEAERTEFHVWTLQSGAIVRFQWFYQRKEAFEAAGLAE